MQDLYLVTQSGERHEDHIPIGVFTFDELKNRFTIQECSRDFHNYNDWYNDIKVLSTEFIKFSVEEVNQFLQNGRPLCWDNEEYYYYINILKLHVNEEIPRS